MSRSEGEIRLRDGRTLAYVEYGSPSGKPIIHCHGAPSARVEGELSFGSAHGCTRACSNVDPSAVGFYRKLGFEERLEERSGTSVPMERQL